MRVAGSILLIIFVVPFLLLGVLSSTVKFQLLNSDFWLSTFEKNNVYSRIAEEIKTSAEMQVEKKGGSLKDAKVLTDLITPTNLKDIISKNLTYTFDYMNGKANDFNAYIPVSKLPRDLLPVTVAGRSDTVPVETLLSEYNIRGVNKNQIWLLGNTGVWLTRLFVVDWIIVIILLLSLFFLTAPGKKFWNLGVTFVLSGLLLLGSFGFLEVIRSSMLTDWPKSSEPSQHILGTFLPFLLQNILIVWLGTGIFLVICGIVLFFVKKGVYNIRK